MKTLSHLQNEAIERLTQLWEFTLLKDPDRTLKEDMIPFLKTELQTIVKESFKNTRVEEVTKCREHWGCDECGGCVDDFNQALSDKHNKECEFLGN